MAEPFLAEIRIMSFAFAPIGWALCNGQLLPINQNQALFALLGTTYGGNGTTNFALPDNQGRVPIHAGNGRPAGAKGGEETHALSISELPVHTHMVTGSAASATSVAPGGKVQASGAAKSSPVDYYSSKASNLVAMNPSSVTSAGGGQAHENRQPFLTLNFCIALQGIFPTRN